MGFDYDPEAWKRTAMPDEVDLGDGWKLEGDRLFCFGREWGGDGDLWGVTDLIRDIAQRTADLKEELARRDVHILALRADVEGLQRSCSELTQQLMAARELAERRLEMIAEMESWGTGGECSRCHQWRDWGLRHGHAEDCELWAEVQKYQPAEA